jgi:arylsulfatase A-like enzyme
MNAWVACLLAGALGAAVVRAAAPLPERPNFVVIYMDDMGYADVGCFGAKIPTPHMDRLAAEGMRFTNFHVAQAVCSASRAALLTGCYPNRIGISGALGPYSKIGISDEETTIAELLAPRGYVSGVFGKWHLGDSPRFLPLRHGFREFFGLPYSGDMWPHHPANPEHWPPLPLIEGDRVLCTLDDQTYVTTWYTRRAVEFIQRYKDRPFFLYVPHSLPHVPLFVSDRFRGKSGAGLYGDVIMELDWSVGQIMQALKDNGLDEKTLVVVASDNGPWLLYGNHAGSSGPLREGKATSFEGGVRVTCIMRWPGHIPAGRTCTELAATIDLLPTFARLAAARLPKHKIDGRDIWPLMAGEPGAKSPHDAYYVYWNRHLQAVISGHWKLHFPHSYPQPHPPGQDGKPGKYRTLKIGQALFDLRADVGEQRDVAAEHPDVVARLRALADRARADLGDSATGQKGRGVRPPGRLKLPLP